LTAGFALALFVSFVGLTQTVHTKIRHTSICWKISTVFAHATCLRVFVTRAAAQTYVWRLSHRNNSMLLWCVCLCVCVCVYVCVCVCVTTAWLRVLASVFAGPEQWMMSANVFNNVHIVLCCKLLCITSHQVLHVCPPFYAPCLANITLPSSRVHSFPSRFHPSFLSSTLPPCLPFLSC